MPQCPKCHKSFEDGTDYCPEDGEPLEDTSMELAVAATAYGPADVRDTKSSDSSDGETTPSPRPDRPTIPDPGPEELIGETIGGIYKVVEILGVGGMGVVYRVEHKNLKKEFALKVLGQIAKDHPDAVERFRQEAIAASHIEHDNIVDIITLDETKDGNPYIVMEVLRGESLADALSKEEPLSLDRALSIAYQISRALHAAHEAGIIHRDLKPENIYLTPKGDIEFVKILDFGISKIHDAEADRVRITKTGHVLGTPLYMSPEQAKGESKLDRRVDIYSLGVMLYEMLEGHPPFSGENYFQLIWKHSNETAPPLEGEAPEALKKAVLTALSKDPEERFESMLTLEEALIDAVPDIPPPSFLIEYRTSRGTFPSRPVGAKRGRKSLSTWIAAGLGASVIVGLGLAFGLSGQPQGAGLSPNVDAGNSATDSAPMTDASSLVAEKTVSNLADGAVADASPTPTKEAAIVPIEIAIDTTPSGATVFLGDEEVGTTPFRTKRAPSDTALELRLVKRGFTEMRRELTPDRDVELEISLRRRRSKGGGSQGGGSGSNPLIKTTF